MICTVTFNPSLDYIVDVEDFKLGLTNRTSSELILPGGKGINVFSGILESATELWDLPQALPEMRLSADFRKWEWNRILSGLKGEFPELT